MDITDLLLALQARAPWASARRVLVMSDLEAAMGWPKTLARYKKANVDKIDHDTLEDFLTEHILAGEKSLQFYKVSKAEFEAVRKKILAEKLNAAASVIFPKIPDLTSIAGISKQPSPVARIDNADGLFLVFGSAREYEERVPVDVTALGAQIQNALVQYSEVYGIRKVAHQSYDVVWLPARGSTVVVACDAPRGAPSEFSDLGHSALRSYVRKAVGNLDLNPRNLFNAIEKIYRSNWGKVVELGFTTDTGSVKHERMRQQRLCLREEIFHMGGKAAVADVLHPFSISVSWAAKEGTLAKWRPELTLHSGVRQLHSLDPTLYSAIFRHGLRTRDLRVLRSRLLKYV